MDSAVEEARSLRAKVLQSDTIRALNGGDMAVLLKVEEKASLRAISPMQGEVHYYKFPCRTPVIAAGTGLLGR